LLPFVVRAWEEARLRGGQLRFDYKREHKAQGLLERNLKKGVLDTSDVGKGRRARFNSSAGKFKANTVRDDSTSRTRS